jgi:hypothetical protein
MENNVNNNNVLKFVGNLPSNNGVEESGSNEEGYTKLANITIDPLTGEQKILSTEDYDDDDDTIDDTTFEDLVADIESGKIKVESDNSPIKGDELKEEMKVGILDELGNITISDEDFQVLLEVVNRRQNKEDFNVYRALPESIKAQINKSVGEGIGVPEVATSNPIRALRNQTAEMLIDDTIVNISMQRAQNDLNKEIEDIFKSGASDIAEYTVGYTKERNEKYRKYAEELEDKEKRERLLKTLDIIESAFSLVDLKEYAKTCKIKKYDLENPKNYFRDFMYKYKDSTYDIYDINLTLPILDRYVTDGEKYNNADVIAFMVCFCKYIQNYKVENPMEHAFMYYVIYNICVMDSLPDTSEEKERFMNNVREVMDNLKERNSFLK